MNKFEKAIHKLSLREQKTFWMLARQIFEDFTKVPDYRPLKGKKGYYRVRFGNHRIIFRIEKGKNPQLIDLRKRDENTYKHL